MLSPDIASRLDTFLSVHPTGTIVVYGPTACGKTAMSIDIAKYCNSEIVSADARQIYTGLDIGTGKITPEEMQNIPHYMLDVCSVEDEFSVYVYRDMAITHIENIRNKGKPPIVCGGTGLYIDSVVYARSYIQIPVDTVLRTELENIRTQQGNTALWERLYAIDPIYARTLHPNNYQYVMRGIEVYVQSGKSKMDIRDEYTLLAPTLFLTPYTDSPENRHILYTRIDERVENMFKIGLLEEVGYTASILQKNGFDGKQETRGGDIFSEGVYKGVHDGEKNISNDEVRSFSENIISTAPGLRTIGYAECMQYIRGEISLPICISQVQQHSRNYAKRQITWNKKYGK